MHATPYTCIKQEREYTAGFRAGRENRAMPAHDSPFIRFRKLGYQHGREVCARKEARRGR